MFCEYCGAKILDNPRFCGECGHSISNVPAQKPTAPGQVYCDNLDRRLRSLGFGVERDVSAHPYHLDLVAQKKGLDIFIELFRKITAFIAAMPTDIPDPTSVSQFSERVAGFAKDCGATSHLFMTMTFPIVVAESIDNRVRSWVTNSKMGPHYNMIVFPVIVVHSSREIVFCQKTGFVAAVQYPKLREFAAKYLEW
jgi:hypothetical protein